MKTGKIYKETPTTCIAAAGTLIVEFGTLSILTNNYTYYNITKRAILEIWKHRSKINLLGSDINSNTGAWSNGVSWTGLSCDSYYEYLIKGYSIFNDPDLYVIFNISYHSINQYLRKGPYHLETDMNNGNILRYRVAAVQAFWPSIEVLIGNIELAEYYHKGYYQIWKKYKAFPETYDIREHKSQFKYYPLRPEFIESTYYLYEVTKNPYYLKIGIEIINDLIKNTKVDCGFASIADTDTYRLEDRLDSYFFSETIKYLYLLMNSGLRSLNSLFPNTYTYGYLQLDPTNVLFTTQGHFVLLDVLKKINPNWKVVSEFRNINNKISKSELVCKTYTPRKMFLSSSLV